MKTHILTLLIAGFTVMAGYAQETDRPADGMKTIFGEGEISHGFYGGITLNYSQIGGEDALLPGMRAAWLINHRLGIGLAGYGFFNDMSFEGSDYKEDYIDYHLAGGYGGLLIEPIVEPMSPLHVSFPVIIGAGGIARVKEYGWDYYEEHDDDDNRIYRYREDAHAYFVVEPGVEMELNLIRYMRLALGVSYRFTSDVVLENTSKTALHGLSGGVTLKFGKF